MDIDISFGQVVKQRRASLGLTQTEVARRAGCAAITIRKIEADALRPSVQMAELIALALNIPEEEQVAFVRLARVEPELTPIPTPSPSPHEIGLTDLSGRAIKGFQLGEQIGSGGFGVVYRAVQPSIEREVAVKIILPRYANHPNFIRRFEAEAQIIARLEHPHIVPLYDYWREPNAAYLIMRLLRGGSLAERLQRGPLTLELVLQFIQQIGSALDMAHRHGIVHRDIKPANVLLDEEQNAYLADFGIAKNLTPANNHHSTSIGVLIGSPAYLSPKQILGESVQPQSDIYCLGILLYEMLTGQQPFPALTPAAYIQKHLNERLPSLQTHRPELPPALDKVIQRATVRDIHDRFRDVPALLDALQNALSSNYENSSSQAAITPTVIELNTQEWAALENPYKGLRAFGEADAADFHGRATLIQEMFAYLSEPTDLVRFLAVVGPSGSGKSSVVKAGLLPALRRGGLPDSENWFIVDITPGPHPWEELEAAFLRVAINPPETLLGQLKEDDRGLIRAVQRILPNDKQTELVLVIDQFEELFTLVEDEVVREQFLNGLVTAVLDPRSRLRLIITLRADFYDRPLQYMDFGDLLRQRTVTILPMDIDELEQAITQPAARVGVQLEPGLVAAIIREVEQQPGTLPLLQYALTELFEKRNHQLMTRTAYEATGGVTGAIARRADEIFESLNSAERVIARQLFLRLITLGEGVEDTRRRVLRSELAELAIPGVYDAGSPLDKVIDIYGRYRLLTFDHNPNGRAPTIEVAHEALLREWERLRDWLRKSRADIRLQRLLSVATQEWINAGKIEGFLLRGARLDQFEGWDNKAYIALTQDEQAFLTVSSLGRQQRRAEEQTRQQRELETAQQLAETERQRAQIEQQRAQEQALSAQNLKRRAIYLGVALVVALILAVAAVAFGNQATQNASLAATKEAIAQDNFLQAEQQRLATQALSNDDSELSALLALRSLQFGYSEEADLALLSALAQGFSEHTYQEHSGRIIYMDVSANGRYLATSGSTDQLIIVWDTSTHEMVYRFDLDMIARDVEFTPDSRFLVMSDYLGRIQIIDLETGEMRELIAEDVVLHDFTPLDISSAGNLLLYGSVSTAKLLDLASGQQIQLFSGHTAPILNLLLSSDETIAITASIDKTVRLWNVASGEEIKRLTGHEAAVMSLALSPDGKSLLTSSKDGMVYLWDLDSGEIEHSFIIGPPQRKETSNFDTSDLALGVSFSPNGKQILLSTMDKQLRLYDRQTGQLLHVWADAGGEAVAWMPDGRHIVASTVASEINLWSLPSQPHPLRLSRHPEVVRNLAFSSQGDVLLSGSDREIRRWDAESGKLIEQYSTFGEGTVFLFTIFDEREEQILAIDGRGSVHTWNLRTGQGNNLGLACFICPVFSNIGLSKNGRFALVHISSLALGEVQSLETGDLRPFGTQLTDRPSLRHGNLLIISGARVSPSGRWATYIDPRDVNTVQLWDANNDQMAHAWVGHTNRLTALDFSADERFLLSASFDGTARIWDITSGQEVQRFNIPTAHIEAAVFSADGRFVLTGDSNNMARLWDVATGAQVRIFGGQHENGVTAVAFSPDGQRIATGDGTGDIRIWDVNLDKTIQLACAQLPRDFTNVEFGLYHIPQNTATCPP